QEFGGGRWVAPVGHALRDHAEEPARVRANQEIGKERGAKGQQHTEQGFAPKVANRLRPVAREKAGELPPYGRLHAVDLEVGPRRQTLQISDERAVERRVAGDGQRRQGRPIKTWKREQ